jgi:phosphoserine aminotransferase
LQQIFLRMARKQTFFTAGPAELYPRFEEFLQEAVDQQLGSISHRSGQFKKIYQHTDEQLRILLNIPAENAIMFTGTASEIWERIIINLTELETFHLVNGSFSKKFWQYAQDLERHAHLMKKEAGQGFSYGEIEVPEYAELICTTQNETSTGVLMREADIHKLKRSNSDKLLAVDMVSSAPVPELDLSLIDTAFFSVQKSFGMPAGLGVWIANEACLAKAEDIATRQSIGAHHRLPELWNQSKEFQTPSTPNVLAIYILGRIAEDMNRIGIDVIRKETETKAKQIYQFFEQKEGFSIGVNNPEHRSKTVAVINTEKPSSEIIDALKAKNLIIGSGYGSNKANQIRISNFVANSGEQIETLLNTIDKLF